MSTVSILPPASRGFSTWSNMTRAGCSLSRTAPSPGSDVTREVAISEHFSQNLAVLPAGSPWLFRIVCSRDPGPVRGGRAQRALGSAFRDPPGNRSHQLRVGAAVAADELRTRPHRGRDPRAAVELLEARERTGGAFQRQREANDPAAVRSGRDVLRLELGRRGDLRVKGLLQRVIGMAVALHRPAVRAADRDHRRMLAGAVVVDLLGRAAVLQAAVELALGAAGVLQERADRLDVQLGAEVRGGCDREVVLVEFLVDAGEQQRLDRVRGGAEWGGGVGGTGGG